MQQALVIRPEQTAVDLFEEMGLGGAPLMVQTLEGLANGTVTPKPQDHSRATLAPLLEREDGRMNFAQHTAATIKNRWRGFQPWPGAFTSLQGKKLIVHKMDVVSGVETHTHGTHEPGEVLVRDDRIFVGCAGNTRLELMELQLEGKRRLAAAEFLRGIHLVSGTRLG
jgi:methionyl-tRNA formyltransferase